MWSRGNVDWVEATLAALPQDWEELFNSLEVRDDGQHYPRAEDLSTNWNTTGFPVEEVQRLAMDLNGAFAESAHEPIGLNPVLNPVYPSASDVASSIQLATSRGDAKVKIDLATQNQISYLTSQLNELLPGDVLPFNNQALPPAFVLNGEVKKLLVVIPIYR